MSTSKSQNDDVDIVISSSLTAFVLQKLKSHLPSQPIYAGCVGRIRGPNGEVLALPPGGQTPVFVPRDVQSDCLSWFGDESPWGLWRYARGFDGGVYGVCVWAGAPASVLHGMHEKCLTACVYVLAIVNRFESTKATLTNLDHQHKTVIRYPLHAITFASKRDCLRLHTHTHTPAHTHTRTCTSNNIHAHANTHRQIHTHTNTLTQRHTPTHKYRHVLSGQVLCMCSLPLEHSHDDIRAVTTCSSVNVPEGYTITW